MYDWYASVDSPLSSINEQGLISELYVDNNNLYLQIPDSEHQLSTLRILIESDHMIALTPSQETENIFDIILDRTSQNGYAVEWNFSRINIDDDIFSVPIGELNLDQVSVSELIISYEMIDALGEIFSSGITNINYMPPLPQDFAMIEAYPNPFNPITNIDFIIPNDCHVDIKIYDIHGREIAILVSEQYTAGHHSTLWDAEEQSSGVYFVKMITEDFVNTQKLMLIK